MGFGISGLIGPLDVDGPGKYAAVECCISTDENFRVPQPRSVLILRETVSHLKFIHRYRLPEMSENQVSSFAQLPDRNGLLVAVKDFRNVYQLHYESDGQQHGQFRTSRFLVAHNMPEPVRQIATLSAPAPGSPAPGQVGGGQSALIGITFADFTLRVFGWSAGCLEQLYIVDGPPDWHPAAILSIPSHSMALVMYDHIILLWC